jgi:hypothetical protein
MDSKMVHHIQVFAELHWAVTRPILIFSTDGNKLDSKFHIINKENFVERVFYEFNLPSNNNKNILKIELVNKKDEYSTTDSDHWIDLKNIIIDGVPADWLIHRDSCFNHSMPDSWVADMEKNGINILPEYTPGTEIRLNGICSFYFEHPYLLYKIIKECQGVN